MTATALENPVDDVLYAADDAAPAEPEAEQDAPYGWTTDPDTGERRPKLKPGRPRHPRSAEELAAAAPVEPEADKPPAPRLPRRRRGSPPPVPPPDDEVPMPKGGVIAKGVDRLYRRAGKLVRVWNHELGTAFIECTRPDPDDPDALTVGQAWENVARDNPRIRAWLVNLLKGGDWQELLFAHAPIGIAIVTSTWVGRLIPFGRVAESMLEPDEDTEPGDLEPADAAEMMATAEAQAQKIAAKMGVHVPEHVARQAMRQAEAHAQRMGVLTPPYDGHDLEPDEASGNGAVPAAFRRQQPKSTSRAQRRR